MDIFSLREALVEDYKSFSSSFVQPRDKRIAAFLEARLSNADQWLDPWLSLNPSFATGGTAADLVGRRQRRTPAVIVNCGASDWSLDRPHAEDRCSPSRHRDPQRRAADSAAPGSYFRWK